MVQINITSLGDPLSPATWSGTPAKITSELAKRGALGRAFDSSFSRKYFMFKVINKIFGFFIYGNVPGKNRGIMERFINAIGVDLKLISKREGHTLHLGTLDLPLVTNFSKNKHYLFCDSTWQLWSSFSTADGRYSSCLHTHAEMLEQRSYSQMTHIFTVGAYVKDNLVNHYKVSADKITVVGTGLGGIVPFYGQKDYSNNKILFVAKDRFKDKGGELVLDAMKLVSTLNSQVTLYIVGQDSYISDIDLPNVKPLGYVSKEVLQQLFNECSLFVMPAFNEPWGLVYLEAMACKMPIIGLDRNSFPEISGFGKYGFSLQKGTQEELAKTIVTAFQQPKQLEKMGLAAQNYCLSNFSWEGTVDKIINKIRFYDR